MKWLLALVGAFVGGVFGNGGEELLGIGFGVIAGLGLAQLLALRQRVNNLEEDLERLRSRAAAIQPPPAAAAASPAGWRAPQPEPAPVPEREAAATSPPDAEFEPEPAVAAASSGWAEPAPPAGPPAPPREFLLVRLVRDYFTGGNTLVRSGVIVLFFGIAFLLRYVAERTTLPMEFRLAGVALAAIVMLMLGWRLRIKRPGYALAVQGGAVAILYLTVFAAMRLYSLLPPVAAFALLVFITAFAVALAVLQDSMAFAMFAAAGGFAAPLLVSTGAGDHVALFTYYAILNAGLVAIAWFRAWRPLTLLGFVATFLVGTLWGVLKYDSSKFASTEPFLILFFLFYVLIAVLFALRQPPNLKGYVDGTIVFGVPVTAFALQSGLLHDDRIALALSALCVGGLYVGLAAWLWQRHRETLRLLIESFLALGIVFLTLAVPLALDGHWSAATWALEGAALLWVGCRQDRRLPRAAGALLQFGAGLLFAARGAHLGLDAWPVLNSNLLGGVMIAAAAVFSTLTLKRTRANLRFYETPFAAVLFVWGVVWWLIAGLSEIGRFIDASYVTAASLLFLAGSAALASLLTQRLNLQMSRWPALALLPMAYLALLWWGGEHSHPFESFGWIAWPAAFAVLYYVICQHADKSDLEGPDGAIAAAAHTFTLWLAVIVLASELVYVVGQWVAEGSAWRSVAWMLVPWLALIGMPAATARVAWPFGQHATTYRVFAASGLALYLVLWLLANAGFGRGDAAPLPYVPLLNPLDIASGFVVFALVSHWQTLQASGLAAIQGWNPRAVYGGIAALAFVWLNGALLRAIHHIAGVPFELDDLLRSTLVQVSLSIFWAVLALATMLLATRRAQRIVWLVGAALLAVVVAKLFLIDLSRVGSIERIVSFVVVGVLMLVIGYFSPLPPPKDDDKDAAPAAAAHSPGNPT